MTSERLFNGFIPPKSFIPPNKFLAMPLIFTFYSWPIWLLFERELHEICQINQMFIVALRFVKQLICLRVAELLSIAGSGRWRQIPVLNGLCHLPTSIRRRSPDELNEQPIADDSSCRAWARASQSGEQRRARKKLQGSYLFRAWFQFVTASRPAGPLQLERPRGRAVSWYSDDRGIVRAMDTLMT